MIMLINECVVFFFKGYKEMRGKINAGELTNRETMRNFDKK